MIALSDTVCPECGACIAGRECYQRAVICRGCGRQLDVVGLQQTEPGIMRVLLRAASTEMQGELLP